MDRVLDLNKNLIDKYGLRGWKLSLRYDVNDGPLVYKEPIRTTHGSPGPLNSILKDDRSTPVELIRTPDMFRSKSQVSI